jgi:hypothetical protein
MPTTLADPPHAVSHTAKTSSWNFSRWASEFVVIVAGVIAALGANSLWGRWQDGRTEQVYLQQLRSDIGENEKRLEAAIALESQQHDAASAAFRAVQLGNTITNDSAKAWLVTRRGVYYSDPRLLTGTVTALISTGELRLLSDATLRQAVAGYATQIREDRDEFDRFVESLQPPFEALRNLGFRTNTSEMSREQFGPVVAALTGKPGTEVLAALDGVLVANEIRVVYLRRMLETTQRLRRLL